MIVQFFTFCWHKVFHKYSLNIKFHSNPFNILGDMLSTRFHQQKFIRMNVNIEGKDKKARKYRQYNFFQLQSIFFKVCWHKVFHKYSLNIKFHSNPSNIFKDTLRGRIKRSENIDNITFFCIFLTFYWNKVYDKYSLNIKFHSNPFN